MHDYMVQNDTEFRKPTVNSFEKDYDSSDRLIVESVYVNQDVPLLDPVLPEEKGPPDPSVTRAILRFRMQCRLNSLNHRKKRPSHDPKPEIIFKGQNWTVDPVDGKWNIPDTVGNMREVRNNVNTSSKAKKATLTYKEAVLKQNKAIEKIANGGEEKSSTEIK